VVLDGIVSAIIDRTIRRILNDVDLQPHRTRYWRTARLDARFKDRAEKVLWCYAHAERLAKQGIWVVCTDEMPNKQVLERHPIRRAIPGSIEQQEFEYTRHGTVNILTFLIVHTGEMEAVCLAANNAEHYIPELEQFRRAHCKLRGVFLIHDGGASHIAAKTADYLTSCHGWWRPRLTPAHASWLNQGELLNHAFRVPLPEAGVVVEPRGVHRPCPGLLAGVQPALRPPLRVDLDESKDASLVR
jgi:hypothetical protein